MHISIPAPFRRIGTLLLACALLGGCAPAGMRFKATVDAPATDSLPQAYADIFSEWWNDSMEIISMDRARHGIRPTIDTTPRPPLITPASFDDYESLHFAVYKVDVIDEHVDSIEKTHIERGLLESPSDAVRDWSARLRPAGGPNMLQIVIKDASVVERDDHEYDARLAMIMRVCRRDGTVLASTTAAVKQSGSLAADASEEDRREFFRRLLARLVSGANHDLEKALPGVFRPFLDRAKSV